MIFTIPALVSNNFRNLRTLSTQHKPLKATELHGLLFTSVKNLVRVSLLEEDRDCIIEDYRPDCNTAYTKVT